MKILVNFKSRQDFADNFLNSTENEVYLKDWNIKVTRYSGFDDYYITDITNALQSGKVCIQYALKEKNGHHGNLVTTNWIGSEYNCQFDKLLVFFNNLPFQKGKYGYESLSVDNLEIWKSELKAIRVFSPFNLHYIKPLAELPKKWTLTHVYKVIVNGQFTGLKCDGQYSDDYAFDNSVNYMIGTINYPMAWIKKIIEHPSGWHCYISEGRVHVNCHSFDCNSFTPVIKVSEKRKEAFQHQSKQTAVDVVLEKILKGAEGIGK